MVEVHYCESCNDHPAEVTLSGPGGETAYLCTSPECMMAAGMCPSCQVELQVEVSESQEKVYSCPKCDFEQTYKDFGQP